MKEDDRIIRRKASENEPFRGLHRCQFKEVFVRLHYYDGDDDGDD